MEVGKDGGNDKMRERYVESGEEVQGRREVTVLNVYTAGPLGTRCHAHSRNVHCPARNSVFQPLVITGSMWASLGHQEWADMTAPGTLLRDLPALFLLPPAGRCHPGRGHSACFRDCEEIPFLPPNLLSPTLGFTGGINFSCPKPRKLGISGE